VTNPVNETIAIATAEEKLRQERETFDQLKRQDARSFVIQQTMSWIAVVLLPGIAVTCGWIIFNYKHFASATVTVATSALLVDILGVVLSLWKIILGPGPRTLEPVTGQTPTRRPASRKRSGTTAQ
jgi:hypothetical protein